MSDKKKKVSRRQRFADLAKRAKEAGFTLGLIAVPEVEQDVAVLAIQRVDIDDERDFVLDAHLDRVEEFLESESGARATDAIEKIQELNRLISESKSTRDALLWSLGMAPDDNVEAFVDRAHAARLATFMASEAGVRVQMAADEEAAVTPEWSSKSPLAEAMSEAVHEILQANRDAVAQEAEKTAQQVER